MSSFGKKVGPAADGRRRARRREVIAEGAALTLTDIKPCLVEDLSPTGARLAGRNLPGIDSELLLRTEDITALARVKWARGEARGVAFEEGGPSSGQCLAVYLESRV